MNLPVMQLLLRGMCIYFLSAPLQGENQSAITYSFSGGRFGDNLVSYCHAKWLSYKYNIPLLYKPFHYSDQLCMHNLEEHYNSQLTKKFKSNIKITNKTNIVIENNKSILYDLAYFPESNVELGNISGSQPFSVTWNDKVFLALIKEYIKPRYTINCVNIPKECISIAVHIRLGTGIDCLTDNNKIKLIHKIAPLEYYIEALRIIVKMFLGKKIYVYIFTDHDKPEELVKTLKVFFDDSSITFNCRNNNENAHNLNVLEDFFSMTKFDCLIRPESNFSIVASKLADYRVLATPLVIKKENNNSMLTVKIELNPNYTL